METCSLNRTPPRVAPEVNAAMPPFAVSRNVDWRNGLPELRGDLVTLRELRSDDAPSLVAHLNCDAVNRHMASCPPTQERFLRFIEWVSEERRRGSLVCYGVVPFGQPAAIGLIQFWPIERDFFTAEWGFVIGKAFWGTGVFVRGATLAIDAAFDRFNVYRLEARAVVGNTRGNRVLEKLGAVRDGVLRGGFREGNQVHDHVMWSILAPEWRARRRELADAS